MTDQVLPMVEPPTCSRESPLSQPTKAAAKTTSPHQRPVNNSSSPRKTTAAIMNYKRPLASPWLQRLYTN
ncbi:hypothetical protein LJU32_22835 [Pseudomonas sp. B21_DOA]|nr:hypothetical protein LJU32_22835 [Pseudomonas sp. B21_DOA]